MKKIIALILSLTMFLSLATPVFASDGIAYFTISNKYAQVGTSFVVMLESIPENCSMIDLNGFCTIGKISKITGSTDYVVEITPNKTGLTQLILRDKAGYHLVAITINIVKNAGTNLIEYLTLTFNEDLEKITLKTEKESINQVINPKIDALNSYMYLNVMQAIVINNGGDGMQLCDTAGIIKTSTPMRIAGTNQYIAEIKGISAGKTQLYIKSNGVVVGDLVPVEILMGEADDETLTYYVDDINGSATVADVFVNVTGAVSVPLSYDSYSVTAIGDGAFANTDGLLSVTIRDNVTSFGNNVFDGLSEDFKILCYEGSPVSEWAEENNVNYEYIDIDYGDVNNSGAVDIFDLISLAKYIVGSTSIIDTRAANVEAADKNDSSIDIFDLIMLAKHICNPSVSLGPTA